MPAIAADGKYHIDLSWNDSFLPYVAFLPEDLVFDDQIRGPGNCSFTISLSATDEDDNLIIDNSSPLFTPNTDLIGPYRHYYRLRYGNVCIQAGVIVSTNIVEDDDFISFAGKTWEHFTEKWQYPFDPRDTPYDENAHVNDYRYANVFQNDELIGSGHETPTGLAYEAWNRDLIRIFKDIFIPTMAVPSGNRPVFDITSLGNLCGIKTDFYLSLGDSTYMDSFINGLASTHDGFDWWISWDKKVLWATPYRFGDPGNPTLAFIVDSTTPLEKGAIGYGNNGPVATHVIGGGAGFAVQTTLKRAYGYQPGHNEFTRLDASYDFGDVRNKDQLIKLTQKQLSLDLQPQHAVPLKLNPAQIADFWSTFRKGRGIWVDHQFRNNWHHIDHLFQLKSYSARDTNNMGNVTVDFALEQRYSLSVNAGSPEG